MSGSGSELPPLLVMVGPTAVGKTAVAVRLAERWPLEVVSADSRQIYRGLDVGTGKPDPAARAAVVHHLLDIAEPAETYHAARFRRDALAAMDEIRGRARLPAVVGGTGLYVRALLKGLRPAPPADPALRAELEARARAEGAAALHAELVARDPSAAARLHPNDRVRVVRALEVAAGVAGPRGDGAAGDWAARPVAWRLVMVGLTQDRARLNARIAARVRAMLAGGMVEETERALATGVPASAAALAGIGYRHVAAMLAGRLDRAEVERLMIRDTTRYAKRQLTWFARDPEIDWIDIDAAGGTEGAADAVLKRLQEAGWHP